MSRDDRGVRAVPPSGDELDAINQLIAEDRELAPALEAVVGALGEDELPAGGFEALRARLGAQEAAGDSAAREVGRESRAAAVESNSAWERGAGAAAGRAEGSAPRRPPTSSRAANGARWAVGLVLVAAVVTAGSWASLKAGEAAKLRDDQRILAYWMANPEMRLVSLDDPARPETATARLGIVCVLPDGRALLLQPAAAPRGATYLVVGDGPSGSRELARGRDNLLQFDAGGVSSVEVVLASGQERTVIAQAQLN